MQEFNIYFLMFKESLKKNKKIYTNIKIVGDSMLPTMHNGEIYEVEHRDIDKIGIGDIIVYNIWGDHLTVHRVVEISKDNNHFLFKTKGDNNKVLDNYQLTENQILGVIKL